MAESRQPAFTDADWSVADELIVATEHLPYVRNLVGQHIKAEAANPRLGLTRVLIRNGRAARSLAELVTTTPGAAAARSALAARDRQDASRVTTRPSADVLGTITRDIRALAIAQHSGWTPTVGRNRLLSFPGSVTLGATREISFGAAGRSVGATREISFGGVGASREISFGGGGKPARVGSWKPSRPRRTGPGRGVRVGVLDSGIWPHPWLDGSWVARPSDVLPDRPDLPAVAGHGTFVAGLVLDQAPGATIEVRRVLDHHGLGTAWEVAEAIVELGQSGIDVLNLSFSCYTADARPPLALARAVDRVDASVVVVAAAGNHAVNDASGPVSAEASAFQSLVSWPAALDDVVAVGATTRDGSAASFSPERPWVDVAARGVDLRSTYLPSTAPTANPVEYGDGWAEWSGTSFAAALVSGAVAAGVDPGRVTAPEAAADLLAGAVPVTSVRGSGQVSPPRLALRSTTSR